MEGYFIERTQVSPEVKYVEEDQALWLSGRSILEDARSFYSPVINKLKEHLSYRQGQMNVNLDINYLNSASNKMLIELLEVISRAQQSGHQIKVSWYYDQDDEDMIEIIRTFGEIANVEIDKREKEG